MSTNRWKTISVLVADDHPLALDGVRSILDKASDIEIVGEVSNSDGIKKLVAKLCPQVLLLDLVMPDFSPVELEKWVRENYPKTITLVLTAHDRDSYLVGMIDAGAAGYLDKKIQAGQLISSIRRVARGEVIFSKKQIERMHRWREDVTSKWKSLTDREREVLQMLTEGADNKLIAASIRRSINTVEKHLTNIYKKLGVTSRSEAILWWVEKIMDFRN